MRSEMTKKFLSKQTSLGVVCVGALLAGLLSFVSPASAGNCYDDGCNGLYSSSENCTSGAWSPRYTALNGMYVELRYQPTCRVIWARVHGATPHTDKVRVERTSPPPPPISYTRTAGGGGFTYTKMMGDAGKTGRACAIDVWWFGTSTRCTASF